MEINKEESVKPLEDLTKLDKKLDKKKYKVEEVAVLYLKEGSGAEIYRMKPNNEGFFQLFGRTYHNRRDCIYSLGKERIPLAILPEWNLLPLGTKAWDDKDMQEKIAICQDHAMKGIRHAERVRMGEAAEGMSGGAKMWIAIGLGVLVGLVLLVNWLK